MFFLKSALKIVYLRVIEFFALIACQRYLLMLSVGQPYKFIAVKLSKVQGFYGIILRRLFYKKTLCRCGDELTIHSGSYIVYKETEIGNRVAIEEDCVISLCKIGDHSIVSHKVSVMSGGSQHDVDNLQVLFRDSIMPLKKVTIGKNVWIGVHSVVLSDIAENSVVAAGSVVVKPNKENSIIAGVPAKHIRFRGNR